MNLELIADRAARLRRTEKLTMSAAVWRVLRAQQLAQRADAKQIASDVLSKLQQRSTARRRKNRQLNRVSPRVHEQLEFEGMRFNNDTRIEEALRMIAQRGGDPDD